MVRRGCLAWLCMNRHNVPLRRLTWATGGKSPQILSEMPFPLSPGRNGFAVVQKPIMELSTQNSVRPAMKFYTHAHTPLYDAFPFLPVLASADLSLLLLSSPLQYSTALCAKVRHLQQELARPALSLAIRLKPTIYSASCK